MADARSDGRLNALPGMSSPDAGVCARGGRAAQSPAQPAPEQPAPERPAPERPAPERPAPERPAPERPAPERPAPERPPRSKRARTLLPAAVLPVAKIAVDIPLAHLDRPFDYLVPERLDAQARPGVRVRVRFAGQLTDGFLLDRAEASEHRGRLSYLDRVVSAEQVLTPEIAALARAVADRYAGTLADVLRLAIPQRHAATELAAPAPAAHRPGPDSPPDSPDGGPAAPRRGLPPRPDPGPWLRYPAGQAFLDAVAAGRPARAAWTALPGPAWPREIAIAAATAASAGRGALIVVPDARDLARVDEALTAIAAGSAHVTLTAELGPAERYRRWLAVLRGQARIVAGTRAAMFAPVAGLGLVVLWDDGDDLHAEPRAPYPHAREVLAVRAHRAGAAALLGGFARTAELAQLVEAGWARNLAPERDTLRAAAPRVRPAADDRELARDEGATSARLPVLALRTVRAALASGPVLVQVPRLGYLAAVGCARCRARASCAGCNGPLRLAGRGAAPDCRWCGRLAGGWRCPRCGHDMLRAVVTGSTRTAEELGRAFPGVKVCTSGGDLVLPRVPDQPALVVATPGAEPLAGYAAALLLDGWALLSRPSLRAAEEALRRWLAAAALVRPGGTVLVHADAALPVTQALIRWDPVTFAERELAERAELGFPPAVRMAAVTGDSAAVASLVAAVGPAFEVLGPVPADHGARRSAAGSAGGSAGGSAAGDAGEAGGPLRALVRAPRGQGAALARALAAAQASRSARKEGGAARVQLDPAELI